MKIEMGRDLRVAPFLLLEVAGEGNQIPTMTTADEKIGQLEDELRQVKDELFEAKVANNAPSYRAMHVIRRLLEEIDETPDGEQVIRRALKPSGDIMLPDMARPVMVKYDIANVLFERK